MVGENRKLLIFKLEEVPELGRGQGVYLQRYKDGGLIDAATFTWKAGLKDENGRLFEASELKDWRGERAQAGRIVPRGWAKSGKFGEELAEDLVNPAEFLAKRGQRFFAFAIVGPPGRPAVMSVFALLVMRTCRLLVSIAAPSGASGSAFCCRMTSVADGPETGVISPPRRAGQPDIASELALPPADLTPPRRQRAKAGVARRRRSVRLLRPPLDKKN